MSNMKCPICGQELKNINLMWFCENESCRAYDWTMEEAAWQELIRTRKALDKGMEHITGLNNMIESWYKLLQSDKDASTKYAILKSAISAYVENKGGNNE